MCLTNAWFRIHHEHGYNVYLDKASHIQLKLYFKNVDQTPVKILEEDLCDRDQFGFKKYQGGIAQLAEPSWATGLALQVTMKANGKVQGRVSVVYVFINYGHTLSKTLKEVY